MKKTLAIILLSAILLTACDNTEKNNSDNSDSNTNQTSSSAEESSGNSADLESSKTESSGIDVNSVLSELEVQSFVAPNGETVSMSEAVGAYEDENGEIVLNFDFGYLRYARPYYYECEYTGDFTEGLYRIEDEQKPAIDALPKIEWIKVRKGDKLDCGLTVKNVEYLRYGTELNSLVSQKVEFDGELELEGMLYVTESSNDYFSHQGDLNFIPDTVKQKGLPVTSPYYTENFVYSMALPNDDGTTSYVGSDIESEWHIGNINDGEFDRQEIFGSGNIAKVKVKLKNIYAHSYATGVVYGQIIAEIEEIEKV